MNRADSHIRGRASIALHDSALVSALARAARASAAIRAIQRGDSRAARLKAEGTEIRRRSVSALPVSVFELKESLERRGFEVYYAQDAAEVRKVVLDIVGEVGARTVVKSKSMASEEVGLTEALEKAGTTVYETDLGEFIVQLAGEAPAHILAPAINWSASAVAELFRRRGVIEDSDVIGSPPDKTTLTRAARRFLRQRFLEADVGITGANFACAREGVLVGISNEGNLRLCVSLPRVHIALVPIEKIVPSVEDLAVLLPLLTTTATAQPLTSYVSLIAGPRKSGESDGPERSCVVLLDNGRSALASTRYESVLRCVRCGACLNACPVYTTIGGHAYGAAYMGPIGAVLSTLIDADRNGELPYASSLCGACTEVCPVGIPLHELLYYLRQDRRFVAPGRVLRTAIHAWAATWKTPVGSRIALRAASSMASLADRIGLGRLEEIEGLRFLKLSSGHSSTQPQRSAHRSSRAEWVGRLSSLASRALRRSWIPAPVARSAGEYSALRTRAAASSTSASSQAVEESRRDIRHEAAGTTLPQTTREPEFDRSDRTADLGELVERFCRSCRQNGAVVQVTDAAGVASAVLGSVPADARVAVAPSLAASTAGAAIIASLRSSGVVLVNPNSAEVSSADVGLTDVRSAVAETGTIVLEFDPRHPRTPSLLPYRHIAVVESARLVPSLKEVFSDASLLEETSGAVLVSGPSKTADIEMSLVQGVHGPGELVIVVVENAEEVRP